MLNNVAHIFVSLRCLSRNNTMSDEKLRFVQIRNINIVKFNNLLFVEKHEHGEVRWLYCVKYF